MGSAAHQADTGLSSYDHAKWDDWIPKLSNIVLSPSLNCLLQSCPDKPAGRNETVVPAGGTHHVLLFWTKGAPSLNYQTDARRQQVQMPPWSGIHLPPDQPSWWEANWQSSDGIFHIHIARSLVDQARLQSRQTNTLASKQSGRIVSNRLTQASQMLYRLVERDPSPPTLLLDSYSIILAHHLVDPESHQPLVVRGGLAPWQVRRCREFLNDNFNSNISLEQLAELVNLSPFHFARAFKQSTGVPPHKYQLGLRIKRAKLLLELTETPVTEVAFEVGYESSQALARLFRREIGISPIEYRRQHRP